jgi:3-oxoacyl-[acyl-carrier-protein] synthase-3
LIKDFNLQKTIVEIVSTGVYFPEQKITNEDLIEHFDQQGIAVEGLFQAAGRDTRYKATNEETTFYMGIEAARMAIENAGIDSKEIDMIIFTSETAEYTSPIGSIFIAKGLGIEEYQKAYDLNANCVSMITAMDEVRNTMVVNHRIRKALIIGSTKILQIAKPDDAISLGLFGDGAGAVVLERKEISTENRKGILDAMFYTNPMLEHYVRLPECGWTGLINGEEAGQRKIRWNQFPTDHPEEKISGMIKDILKENNYTLENVDHIVCSQFALNFMNSIAEKSGIPTDKNIYVGDRVGYTGTSSPIVALHYAMEENKIKEGDLVIFWSVGAGYTATVFLYKF